MIDHDSRIGMDDLILDINQLDNTKLQTYT